jgi:hypothetical protein
MAFLTNQTELSGLVGHEKSSKMAGCPSRSLRSRQHGWGPLPGQVKGRSSPHEKAQPVADVRAVALLGTVRPAGLR